jgi:NADH:quinone reductase (non-electrogenic)
MALPRVLIVGGGMGGIAAAKALARAPVEITLVDGRNYYLFQPLIYEVANALLNVEDVAHSIRGLLRDSRNVHFRLGTASSVDWHRHELVLASGGRIGFDYLVLAAGLETDFRGVPGAAEYGLPLKTLDDALRIRTRMLRRLELAAADPQLVSAGALDVVIVGGGTTGVETAAASAEIYRHALCEEFPELDLSQASIVLLEAGDALLAGFRPSLRRAAQRMLERHGVEVRLRSPVAEVGPASVKLTDGAEIAAGSIVWATGVRAPALADSLGFPQAADGRVLVEPNLGLPGHPEAFVVGDMAALPWSKGGLHPALAQFAIQGGRHAGREIKRKLVGERSRPFHYRDKGMTASVGRDAAVVQAGPIRFGGRAAFFFWRFLHALYVPGFRNRLSVALTWIWTYATRRRAALLLVGEETSAAQPTSGEIAVARFADEDRAAATAPPIRPPAVLDHRA